MQKGFDDGEMDMLTGKLGLTTIRYWMLDAGLLDVHISLDVKMHCTWSLVNGK